MQFPSDLFIEMFFGNSRKWHFRNPKFPNFYEGTCLQIPLVWSVFGARYILRVRTFSKSHATPLILTTINGLSFHVSLATLFQAGSLGFPSLQNKTISRLNLISMKHPWLRWVFFPSLNKVIIIKTGYPSWCPCDLNGEQDWQNRWTDPNGTCEWPLQRRKGAAEASC